MAVPLVNIGGRWDYTDAEWEEICAAVKRVRPDPVSDTERKALRLTADDYIAGVRDYPKRKTQANEQRAWKKASGLISDSLLHDGSLVFPRATDRHDIA